MKPTAAASFSSAGVLYVVMTLLGRRLPTHGREELCRNGGVRLKKQADVRNHWGSQVVEKQALKALALKAQRCLFPEVRLPIGRMVAHASLAMRTDLRWLFRIQTPRRRKQVEGVGAVRAGHRVVGGWGQPVHSTSRCHRGARARERVCLALHWFGSTRRNRWKARTKRSTLDCVLAEASSRSAWLT